MSAIEAEGRVQDTVERVATITALPARHETETLPALLPTREQVAALICPPDLWSDDRPSLRKVWLYGLYGRWTAADGFARWAGVTYAVAVVLPLTTALYMAQWVIERPARLLVAATLVGLTILAL